MGNNNGREARPEGQASPTTHRQGDGGSSQPTSPTDSRQHVYPSRGRDLSFLGLGNSNANEVPERRETKQEREARKLEKERQARVKERERSLKEEHVDYGYLVTMGVYTGAEDFSKPVVRQLMIERRMAPFWRGLNDFSESWAEHQIVAAARGLPIPAADEIPSEELSKSSPHASNHNLQGLMVPISSRSYSTASDASANLSPSHPAFSNTSSSIPTSTPTQSSSPFRPRSKTLASLTGKNPSSSDIVPREINLPKDPYVNGQQVEVFLYKDATECPICFLTYPPYLNKTRCCDQAICSECFVQIKRPDPHPPEHHDATNPTPADLTADAEALVSEPACCPYCQQPEFGVTYDAPPFRRGLSYANAMHGLASFASAMSSSSSINSTNPPTAQSPFSHKRRTTSISANASTVITTDRVRPDWATKLANARAHLARRSAAATALHTAAYLMNGTPDPRGFGFRSSRLTRNRGESNPSGAGGPATEPGMRSTSDQPNSSRRDATENRGSRRRDRVEDLEEMMMMEAIRLSLAAEEDRKKKAEKEAAKEAKKKAKEDKKKEKKERRGVYGSGASSASGSTLSLNLPGLGRRRGNSAASTLQTVITPEDATSSNEKGKGVDRGPPPSNSTPIDFTKPGSSSSGHSIPVSRQGDTTSLAAVSENQLPSASPNRPSHLRQMSNASSPASSFIESIPGSLRNDLHTHGSNSTSESPNTSGTHINGHTGADSDGHANGHGGEESMFNFSSLAAMIGKEDDANKEDAARHIEYLDTGESSTHPSPTTIGGLEESVATLKLAEKKPQEMAALEPHRLTPEVTVTPETPAALTAVEDNHKQLGESWSQDVTPAREITQ